MTARRLAVAGGVLVAGLAGPAGVAAGQETTVPPGSDPAATSTTVSTTTTTVCLEPQPQWPFVGTVSAIDGDRVTFAVQQAPSGSPLPPDVNLVYPDQGRYLDDGVQYYVVAFGPQAELEEAGAAGAPTTATTAVPTPAADGSATTAPVTSPPGPLPQFLYGRVKLADGECGALTRYGDGREIDTAVLKPLVDNWGRLVWAFVLPLLGIVAALTVIVVLKRMAARAVLGPVGAPGPPSRTRRLPRLRP